MTGMTRRMVIGSLSVSPMLLLVGARSLKAAEPAPATPAATDVCAAEDSDGMRGSLNYVATSRFGAERDCRNCQFWRTTAGAACGGCTLIDGLISPTGYCDSWALAPAAATPAAPPQSALPQAVPPATAPPAPRS